jgi:predicted GNAT family N-acyltransferase
MLYANWIHGTEDIANARAVREAVFVNEQGVNPDIEFDAFDAMAWHAVAMDDQTPIATGRVYLDKGEFHIDRLSVLPDYRGFGVGDAVIRLLLDRALMAGAGGVHIASLLPTKDFYKKFGFEEAGEPYTLPGDERMHIDLYADRESIVLPHGCGGSCDGCAGCGEDEAHDGGAACDDAGCGGCDGCGADEEQG